MDILYLFENSSFSERATIIGEYISNIQNELYLSISKLIIGLLQPRNSTYGT